jgi:hypothetical protein
MARAKLAIFGNCRNGSSKPSKHCQNDEIERFMAEALHKRTLLSRLYRYL